MFNIKHIVTNNITNPTGKMERFLKMKRLLDQKCAANLRLLATKNNINRASDYHYLTLAVTQSTEPVNGIDYIHPVLKPNIDYATAVISKGLIQNGEINFEFVPDNENDDAAALQATNMVKKVVNQMNDPHQILQHWIMDALLHKNGEMLISPYREQITRYVKTQGTDNQLKAFEAQAADAGLTATRTSKRKHRIDVDTVRKEAMLYHNTLPEQQKYTNLQAIFDSLEAFKNDEVDSPAEHAQMNPPEQATAQMGDFMNDSISRNTIYNAEYKLVGYNLSIRFRPIGQHYWICDPTVISVQEQPFCGFYDPMTIQEATERYPDIDLEEFNKHAEFNNVGAYQAGSLLNNLAIHARDSVPINGLPQQGYAAQEPEARQVTILTVWNRYDIDNDGELELVEVIYSGSYIISAREVEFIPVANLCPRPLPQNFYGMSLAESLVPAQEYSTAAHRAEIQLGLLTATPRLGVKPDKVDWEMLQDGEAAIFILDSKFDPNTDIFPLPPPSGNLQFVDVALNRIQQDTMALVGMTTPTDTFNPEVMDPGNSGAKLQLAMGPNQIIQDNQIKNAASGLKEALWLVWRTLIQYGDDYGVKKLAQQYHPQKKAEFMDAKSFDDMNFCERKIIHIDLALGMASEENSLQRLQIIKQTQQSLFQEVNVMLQSGALTPQGWSKLKKPYSDMLTTLGVKDPDAYLPSDQEALQMIQQAQVAARNHQPNPQEQALIARAHHDEAKSQLIMAEVNGKSPKSMLESVKAHQIAADTMGTSADKQLDALSLTKLHKATNY